MNTNKKLQITKVQTQKGSQTVGVFLRYKGDLLCFFPSRRLIKFV